MTYGFADSNVAVDKASRYLRRTLASILKAAEYENAIFRLASELERTQRLINALQYLIIPRYESFDSLYTSHTGGEGEGGVREAQAREAGHGEKGGSAVSEEIVNEAFKPVLEMIENEYSSARSAAENGVKAAKQKALSRLKS